MKDTSESQPFFERLKAGLEEGIRWARGNLILRTTAIPEPPPDPPNDKGGTAQPQQ